MVKGFAKCLSKGILCNIKAVTWMIRGDGADTAVAVCDAIWQVMRGWFVCGLSVTKVNRPTAVREKQDKNEFRIWNEEMNYGECWWCCW